MSSYFDNKRKESVNLLFLRLKSIIVYDVDFEDILKTHRVIEANNKELKN